MMSSIMQVFYICTPHWGQSSGDLKAMRYQRLGHHAWLSVSFPKASYSKKNKALLLQKTVNTDISSPSFKIPPCLEFCVIGFIYNGSSTFFYYLLLINQRIEDIN